MDAFVEALLQEIQQRHTYISGKTINTIYFGGGTPSLLSEDHLGQIFDQIHRYFDVHNDAEITLEANPDDLSVQKLKEFQHVNINRLSIGVQSFIQRDLSEMNRAHSVSEAESSVKRAQDTGFSNLTIDLMYGLPQLTEIEWQNNVQKAIDLNVLHISSYCLTLEEKTALHHFVQKGKTTMVSDEVTEQQFITMINMLQNASFDHYEISNFAKEGFISKHNSAYWLGEQYLGLGPSAHSFDGEHRGFSISNNTQYISKVNKSEPYFEIEELTPENRFNEYILIRLRTKWGINLKEIKQRFPQFSSHIESELKKQVQLKYVRQQDSTYVLTQEGKLMADNISVALFV